MISEYGYYFLLSRIWSTWALGRILEEVFNSEVLRGYVRKPSVTGTRSSIS